MKHIFILSSLLILLLSVFLISCNQRKRRNEYYDYEQKHLKSKGEYLNGVLDGNLAIYDEEGRPLEVSSWKNGIKDGLMMTFHHNGQISGEYEYVNGKRQGKYKRYYESGQLKKIAQVDQTGFLYSTNDFDEHGRLKPMEQYFNISSDTLKLGDTLVVKGTLNNIEDSRYTKGIMIIGKKFAGENGDILSDTLAMNSSSLNYYETSFIPNMRGEFTFVAQIIYRFKTDKKLKGIPLDTLDIFSTEGKVFVK